MQILQPKVLQKYLNYERADVEVKDAIYKCNFYPDEVLGSQYYTGVIPDNPTKGIPFQKLDNLFDLNGVVNYPNRLYCLNSSKLEIGTNANHFYEGGFNPSILRSGFTIGTTQKYTSNFTPVYNSTVQSGVIFQLGDNYTDLVSNKVLTIDRTVVKSYASNISTGISL